MEAKRAKPEKRNFKICISMRSKSATLREMKRYLVDKAGIEIELPYAKKK